MKYIKLLWFDIRNGMMRNPMLFVVPVIVTLIACFALSNNVSSLNEVGYFGAEKKGTFADYIMFIYGGMDKYVPDLSDPFVFPVRWVIVFLTLSFITSNYPYKDMQGFGQQILLRTQGRTVWWLSKCGWNILCSLVYHCLIFGTAALFCLAVKGSLFGEINKDLQYAVFEVGRGNVLLDDTPWPFAILVIPVLISLGINLLQMTLSLFVKPIFSFFLIAFLMISSAYFMSPYLIGNYAMPIRCGMVIKDGVGIAIGLAISSVLIIISVGVGMIRFHYYDILNEE